MKDRLFFAMLADDKKFSLTNKGITYKREFYFYCDDPWLNKEMEKKLTRKTLKSISGIRYDPRRFGSVWVMIDDELKEIPLSHYLEEYKELPWVVVDKMLEDICAPRTFSFSEVASYICKYCDLDMENLYDNERKIYIQQSGKDQVILSRKEAIQELTMLGTPTKLERKGRMDYPASNRLKILRCTRKLQDSGETFKPLRDSEMIELSPYTALTDIRTLIKKGIMIKASTKAGYTLAPSLADRFGD